MEKIEVVEWEDLFVSSIYRLDFFKGIDIKEFITDMINKGVLEYEN